MYEVNMSTAIELQLYTTAKYGNAQGKIQQPATFPANIAFSDDEKVFFLYVVPDEIRFKKAKLQVTVNASDTIHAQSYVWLVDNTAENILQQRLNLQNQYDDEDSANIKERTYSSSNYVTYDLYISTAQYIVISGDSWAVDNTIYSLTVLCTIEENIYGVEPIYPLNVNIKNSISHIFSWIMLNGGADLSPLPYSPTTKKHSILYRKKGSQSFTILDESDGNQYQTVAANTFDIDHYEYKIRVYTYHDYYVESDIEEFNSIGQDAAPTISGVTNNSIPTVSWTDSNQAAFEIRIKDAEQNIVYTSGLIVGNNQSYQITKMLPNGTYIVEVRELNIYGIYSDWGSAQFVLNPSSVSAPTDIFVSVNNKFGVEISGTPVGSAQKTYVVRRVAGTDDIEIVGIYTGGIFTDYTAKGNTYYEYTLRNYNVAYADGAFIPVEVKVKEAIIQDGRDVTNFLDLSWSEDVTFNIEYTDEADRTLYKCLGRRYPVKEMGEWVNSVRSFVAYVRAEDINRLNDMNLNAPKVYFKGNHEYYACDMSIEDQGAYVGGGRMIRFTLTRIADDEGIII